MQATKKLLGSSNPIVSVDTGMIHGQVVADKPGGAEAAAKGVKQGGALGLGSDVSSTGEAKQVQAVVSSNG